MTRVLRVYHSGRDAGHRRRERALSAAGVEVTLVVPQVWPDAAGQSVLGTEPFTIVQLPVHRAGDVNRHRYQDQSAIDSLLARIRPDVLDLHEEPFSVAARQWLRSAGRVPVVMYTAQNLDKRFPPPFARFEKRALERVSAMYPCSRQAASVARGKGFAGQVEVIPLGFDAAIYGCGTQSLADDTLVLGIVGRLVPEKGVLDAVRVLQAVRRRRNAVLHIVGTGPELARATELAGRLGVRDALRISPWLAVEQIAELYRGMHVLLIPSRSTSTWVEQFGRVIPEAQASGAVVAGYASGAIAEVAGTPGVLCAQGDVAALASVVTELVTSQEDWAARRVDGVARAERCSWTAVAERQAELYAQVHQGRVARVAVPRGPFGARAAARAEFGEVAVAGAGAGPSSRPMALPVLRDLPRLQSGVGRLIDLTSQGRAVLTPSSAGRRPSAP